jgi:RNA polymerase sigma-70 factor (ECF subfamily)
MNPQAPNTSEQPMKACPPTIAELVDRYGRAVLAVCLAKVGGRDDAEDLMQDVFVKAMTNIHGLRDFRSAGPWILKIARTTCIDYLRRRRPTEQLSDDAPAAVSASSASSEHLRSAIRRLPPYYAEAISLYYLDGRSSLHVAELLGITPEAVRQRLVRARALLHDMLREERA